MWSLDDVFAWTCGFSPAFPGPSRNMRIMNRIYGASLLLRLDAVVSYPDLYGEISLQLSLGDTNSTLVPWEVAHLRCEMDTCWTVRGRTRVLVLRML